MVATPDLLKLCSWEMEADTQVAELETLLALSLPGLPLSHHCSLGQADLNDISLPADAPDCPFPAPLIPPLWLCGFSSFPLPLLYGPFLSGIFPLSTFTVVAYPASSDDLTAASSRPALNYM